MAAPPAGTYQTYQSIGNREDLIDIITNISPVDTWFTSNTGSKKATATLHEWQTDDLAAAAANAVVEGEDAVNISATPTVRLGNYTQILRKTYQVSDTQEVIDKAGRKSSIAYQSMKKTKELAKDIEYALVISSATASGASATARTMNGLDGFIATNVSTASADRALTDDILNDNLEIVWAAGGEPSTVLCGTYQKRQISAFTTNTRNITADSNKLVNAVDIYESDFGTLAIRLHRQINTTLPGSLFVLGDMTLWNKAWLRPVKKTPLAKTGASEKFMMEAELTLEANQELGSGKIEDLTTADA